MKKILQRITAPLLALAFVFGVVGVVSNVAVAQPNIQGSLCTGGNTAQLDGQTDCSELEEGAQGGLNKLITNIINVFSLIVGIVAVIMIIIGGFRYITSGGDSGNVTGAKNTILYAIIGLVIVALSQFIVRFVLAKSAGATE